MRSRHTEVGSGRVQTFQNYLVQKLNLQKYKQWKVLSFVVQRKKKNANRNNEKKLIICFSPFPLLPSLCTWGESWTWLVWSWTAAASPSSCSYPRRIFPWCLRAQICSWTRDATENKQRAIMTLGRNSRFLIPFFHRREPNHDYAAASMQAMPANLSKNALKNRNWTTFWHRQGKTEQTCLYNFSVAENFSSQSKLFCRVVCIFGLCSSLWDKSEQGPNGRFLFVPDFRIKTQLQTWYFQKNTKFLSLHA